MYKIQLMFQLETFTQFLGGKWLKVLFLHCLLCCLANDYHKAGLSVGDEMNGNTWKCWKHWQVFPPKTRGCWVAVENLSSRNRGRLWEAADKQLADDFYFLFNVFVLSDFSLLTYFFIICFELFLSLSLYFWLVIS